MDFCLGLRFFFVAAFVRHRCFEEGQRRSQGRHRHLRHLVFFFCDKHSDCGLTSLYGACLGTYVTALVLQAHQKYKVTSEELRMQLHAPEVDAVQLIDGKSLKMRLTDVLPQELAVRIEGIHHCKFWAYFDSSALPASTVSVQ